MSASSDPVVHARSPSFMRHPVVHAPSPSFTRSPPRSRRLPHSFCLPHWRHPCRSRAIPVIHTPSPSFARHPRHSHTVPIVHVRSPSFTHGPCCARVVPIVHTRSPSCTRGPRLSCAILSFMCHPRCSCAVPVVHALSHHSHTVPSFTHCPVVHDAPAPWHECIARFLCWSLEGQGSQAKQFCSSTSGQRAQMDFDDDFKRCCTSLKKQED